MDDVPGPRLVRPTRALVRRCNREWLPRPRVDRLRTRPHAGGALDHQAASECGCSILTLGTGGDPGGGIGQGGRGWGRLSPGTRRTWSQEKSKCLLSGYSGLFRKLWPLEATITRHGRSGGAFCASAEPSYGYALAVLELISVGRERRYREQAPSSDAPDRGHPVLYQLHNGLNCKLTLAVATKLRELSLEPEFDFGFSI